MLKNVLATTALATLLAAATFAQTAPATDPSASPAPTDAPAAPMIDEGATTPPEVVEDAAPGAMDAETETAAPSADPIDPAMQGEWGPVDLATISTDELIGTDIVNFENETIASIEDVIITDDGQVESLVARFGGFLGFGADRILLTIEEIEVMQDADEEVFVRTNLTPESVESRPAYEG